MFEIRDFIIKASCSSLVVIAWHRLTLPLATLKSVLRQKERQPLVFSHEHFSKGTVFSIIFIDDYLSELEMGPGQTFLTWVRSIFLWLGLGQPSMVWVWKISPSVLSQIIRCYDQWAMGTLVFHSRQKDFNSSL